jgi:KaiC/GvpD/RAD55 family RecA-like ATPase
MDAARNSRVILVTGQPGVGKTALVINWVAAVAAEDGRPSLARRVARSLRSRA